jgi:hypothetical protein
LLYFLSNVMLGTASRGTWPPLASCALQLFLVIFFSCFA